MKNKSCKFDLQPVSPDVVKIIIQNMKTTSSTGLDNINSYVLKLAQEELIPAITHIINLSITQKKFPDSWKISKIITLHKKGEMFLAQNFRPVSLLSVVSKVLEKAIFLQMFKYFEENNLIHPSHHAYRKMLTTTTSLIEMMDYWVEAFENGEITAVVMCDQSAAFDVCDHEILKSKLEIYGLQTGALDWICSYLSNREQMVYIEGALSKCMKLDKVGVPQGGTLSPLLYNIFCSDLPELFHENHEEITKEDDNQENIEVENVNESYQMNRRFKHCGKIVFYADNCTYSSSDKDPRKLENKIEKDFKKISNYMTDNKLFLNSDKTHLMILTSSKSHSRNDDFGI